MMARGSFFSLSINTFARLPLNGEVFSAVGMRSSGCWAVGTSAGAVAIGAGVDLGAGLALAAGGTTAVAFGGLIASISSPSMSSTVLLRFFASIFGGTGGGAMGLIRMVGAADMLGTAKEGAASCMVAPSVDSDFAQSASATIQQRTCLFRKARTASCPSRGPWSLADCI